MHAPRPYLLRIMSLAGGLGVFLLLLLVVQLDPARPVVSATAACAALMALWWITEPIPIPVTSLLPLVLFPALGIMKGDTVAQQYMNSTIFLFLGGFLIALGLEKSGLHRRMALNIVRMLGSRPRKVVLGFMSASAFLSMWISNTAAAMIMLPIATTIATSLTGEGSHMSPERRSNLSFTLLLGIAYGASIGGMATLMGTPPNIALVRIYQLNFPDAPVIGFAQWLFATLPLSIILLLGAWMLLVYVIAPVGSEDCFAGNETFAFEMGSLGPMRPEERRVLVVFLLTTLLWIFRLPIDLGAVRIPGWSEAFRYAALLDDGTVAIAMGILLFILPHRARSAEALLDWSDAARLPWGVLFLFGGGFALAAGFETSGLSTFLGGQFRGLAGFHPLLFVLCIAAGMSFLTELTSNTASTQMILPVLASLAVAIEVHPLLLMVPATLAASCAFILPVATPPNAIVYGSGLVPIRRMATAGLGFNTLAFLTITLYVYFVFGRISGLEL